MLSIAYLAINKLALSVPGPGGTRLGVSPPYQIPTGTGKSNPENLLQLGITLFLITVTILSLFMLIFGGIQWIISQGDKTKLEAARKRIIFAIIGLLVTFLSFFIVLTVGQLFGLRLFELDPIQKCVTGGCVEP